MDEASDILVCEDSLARIVRRGRFVTARFRQPVQALTTCARNGGYRTDLTAVVNHQSCEGARHQERADFILGLGPEGYQAHVCAELGLAVPTTAVMGTAAAMQYLGFAQRSFRDFSLSVLVTAGVHGNAACAGDAAFYDERAGRWEKIGEPSGPTEGAHHGTINTLVLINTSLTPAAMARAVVTLTEAKTAALQRLAIGSRTSRHLATGTGTDQFALVARPFVDGARTWSGHHTKLGELLADAVMAATLEALRWQNGLEASYTRSLVHVLGRFGVTEPKLKESLIAPLETAERSFIEANFLALLHEPQAAAAAYGVAAVLDRASAGTLPALAAEEAVLHQLALLAEAHSAQTLSPGEARRALAERVGRGWTESSLLPAVTAALLLGFRAKWRTLV